MPPCRVHTLSSSRCSLSVVPTGARILSLANPVTGREWLWAPQQTPLDYWRAHDGEVPQRPMIAVDECFPTVAACTLNGADHPAHGEVWTRAWEIAGQQTAEIGGAIDAEIALTTFDGRLKRRAVVSGDGVLLEYELENRGSEARPYLWALHPLLRWETGDRIELSSAVKEVRVSAFHSAAIAKGARVSWPAASTDAILDRGIFGADTPGYAKVFAGPETGGVATLVHGATGEKLIFRWDVAEQPWLGIYICSGGRNGFWHAALEPTTSPHEALSDAVADGTAGSIAPKSKKTWKVSIELAAA